MRTETPYGVVLRQGRATALDQLRTFVREWGFRAGEDDELMEPEFQPTGVMEAMHILDACGRSYR